MGYLKGVEFGIHPHCRDAAISKQHAATHHIGLDNYRLHTTMGVFQIGQTSASCRFGHASAAPRPKEVVYMSHQQKMPIHGQNSAEKTRPPIQTCC